MVTTAAEEHKAFLDWLAEEIRQNEIDALVIAGDVFDVSNPFAASQRIYYEFIYRVTAENPKLQIVIVAGNHDSAARLEAPLPFVAGDADGSQRGSAQIGGRRDWTMII